MVPSLSGPLATLLILLVCGEQARMAARCCGWLHKEFFPGRPRTERELLALAGFIYLAAGFLTAATGWFLNVRLRPGDLWGLFTADIIIVSWATAIESIALPSLREIDDETEEIE